MSEEVKPVDTRPLPPDPDQQAEVFQGLWDAQEAADGTPAEQPSESTSAEPTPSDESPWAYERAERYAEEDRANRGQQLQQAYAEGQRAQQELQAAYQNMPWEQLRAQDPARYMMMQQDFQARQAQINQHVANLQNHGAQLAREHLASEFEKAQRAVPEWRDRATFEANKQEMIAFARQQGFTDNDLHNLTDHRQLVTLWRASQAGKPPKPAVRLSRAKPADGRPAALVAAENRMKKDPRDDHLVAGYFQQLLNAGY